MRRLSLLHALERVVEATGILSSFTGEGGEKKEGRVVSRPGAGRGSFSCRLCPHHWEPGLQLLLVGRRVFSQGRGLHLRGKAERAAKTQLDGLGLTQTLPEHGLKDPAAPRGDPDLVSLLPPAETSQETLKSPVHASP